MNKKAIISIVAGALTVAAVATAVRTLSVETVGTETYTAGFQQTAHTPVNAPPGMTLK